MNLKPEMKQLRLLTSFLLLIQMKRLKGPDLQILTSNLREISNREEKSFYSTS